MKVNVMQKRNPEASKNNESGTSYRFNFIAIFGQQSRTLRMTLIQLKSTLSYYIHSFHKHITMKLKKLPTTIMEQSRHSRRILTLRLIFKEEEATSNLAGFRQVLALIELEFGHVGFWGRIFSTSWWWKENCGLTLTLLRLFVLRTCNKANKGNKSTKKYNC